MKQMQLQQRQSVAHVWLEEKEQHWEHLFIGALMLAVLKKVGMVVIKVDTFWQYIFTGIIIIVASYFEFVQGDIAVFMARKKQRKA